MQECLNKHRVSLFLEELDFSKIKTISDLEPFNVTHEQILEGMAKLKLNDKDTEIEAQEN